MRFEWNFFWKFTLVELNKAQEKVDAISAKLLKLQKQKQEYEVKQIMEAYKKSGKTMRELMAFLDV